MSLNLGTRLKKQIEKKEFESLTVQLYEQLMTERENTMTRTKLYENVFMFCFYRDSVCFFTGQTDGSIRKTEISYQGQIRFSGNLLHEYMSFYLTGSVSDAGTITMTSETGRFSRDLIFHVSEEDISLGDIREKQ